MLSISESESCDEHSGESDRVLSGLCHCENWVDGMELSSKK